MKAYDRCRALVQIIMVSRLLYGMGKRARLLRLFSAVHPRTRTPVTATVAVTALVLTLAVWLPVPTLAEYTSGLVLLVFMLVNGSLIAVKRGGPPDRGVRAVSLWVPAMGIAVTMSLLLYVAWSEFFAG